MAANESLRRLSTSYSRWRQSKRYATERVPAELAERIKRAVAVHGLKAVAKATGAVARTIVSPVYNKRNRPRSPVLHPAAPTFSRIPLQTLVGPSRLLPMLEVETPHGLKLRAFSTDAESLSLFRELVESHRPGGEL
jgi:hypothetical protein